MAVKKAEQFRANVLDLDAPVFTTGQVAKICGTAARTVAKWFDKGELKGYRIPLSEDRRVYRDDLEAFMEKHGIRRQVGVTLVRVLLVGLGEHPARQLGELLTKADGYWLEAAESPFDAGLVVHEFRPAVVVADASVGRGDLLRMARALRSNGSARALLVAVVGEDFPNEAELAEAGYDRFVVRPVDPAALAELIRAGREG